jgi:hypothetical protein
MKLSASSIDYIYLYLKWRYVIPAKCFFTIQFDSDKERTVELCMCSMVTVKGKVKVQVKQSLYRPGQALKVPGV